jgi:hypothetical protein
VKGLAAGARNSSLAALARELSPIRLLPLALAIFALFGLLGPVIDILSLGHIPPAVVFRNTMLSGLVALGYVFGMMRRNWWLFAAAVAVQITWVAGFGGGTALAPDGVPNGAQLRADGIVVIVLMIVSYASFLAFNNLSASSYLRVRAEIDLAHEIHMVLVPPIDRRVGAFEFFGVSSPSGEVGGDLVDVVETGGSWLGYVADVSGHGVSSGVVMGMFKSALRMRLRQPGGLGDLLRDLNDVLFPLKSSAMYVTAACVCGCRPPAHPARARARCRRSHHAADSRRHVRGLCVRVSVDRLRAWRSAGDPDRRIDRGLRRARPGTRTRRDQDAARRVSRPAAQRDR